MARLTLSHTEVFALWNHAVHVGRAPAYEIERAENGGLYVLLADNSRKLLSPVGRLLTQTDERGTDAHP